MSEHRIHVHLPLSMYGKYREAVLEMPAGLELLVDHEALVPEYRSELGDIAAELREAKIACRFHAPFRDLHPAGHDPEAVALARRRLEAALELAPAFGVKRMVVHPAWSPQGDALDREDWLARAELFFLSLVPSMKAADTCIDLENIFDHDPRLLVALLDRLEPDRFAWLLDAGHFNAYSRVPLSDWFSALGSRLSAIHIHDNGGEFDEHLALGRGNFSWPDLFSAVAALDRPLEWTIENRSIADVLASLGFLGSKSGIAEFAPLAEIPLEMR
jgi:sugar phosphate isomerase/epimerase